MTQAAVAILRENGRVLVCRRKKNSRYELKWEFPGGKLEPGESVEACVRRELREELSVDIETIGHKNTQVNHYDDGGMFEVTYCFILKFSGRPANNVFEEIRWVTLAELRTLDFLEGSPGFAYALAESILH